LRKYQKSIRKLIWEFSFVAAVQHERGPRKPKLQHLHSQLAHHHQQHHHHHHHGGFNPMAVNSQSYSHHNLQSHHAGAHFTQLNSFQQHSTILHHPQPLSFAPLLHPTPILPSQSLNHHPAVSTASSLSSKFTEQQQKMASSFDFPSINSNFYKPLGQLQQFSPTNSKSTISIDSSSASSVSERIHSPNSTIDGSQNENVMTPPPPQESVASNHKNANANNTTHEPKATAASFSVSSLSSTSPLTSITNGTSVTPQFTQQSTRNGLLDILLSPDKYQELIQYHQVQNSIMFPSLHHAAYPIDALNPRLPTWEFLQVGRARGIRHYFNRDLTHHHHHFTPAPFVLSSLLKFPSTFVYRRRPLACSSWPFVGCAVWCRSKLSRRRTSNCCCRNRGRNFSC